MTREELDDDKTSPIALVVAKETLHIPDRSVALRLNPVKSGPRVLAPENLSCRCGIL